MEVCLEMLLSQASITDCYLLQCCEWMHKFSCGVGRSIHCHSESSLGSGVTLTYIHNQVYVHNNKKY